jgi:hypothetical protein
VRLRAYHTRRAKLTGETDAKGEAKGLDKFVSVEAGGRALGRRSNLAKRSDGTDEVRFDDPATPEW